jgi:hypothetical protein
MATITNGNLNHNHHHHLIPTEGAMFLLRAPSAAYPCQTIRGHSRTSTDNNYNNSSIRSTFLMDSSYLLSKHFDIPKLLLPHSSR